MGSFQRFNTRLILPFMLSVAISGQNRQDMERLYADKVWNYLPYIRPVVNQADKLTVQVKMNLMSITEFKELVEQISFTAWLDITWEDKFLTWNASDYGGAMFIHVPRNKIWHPNMAVANTMSDFFPEATSTNFVTVSHIGTVRWIPGAEFHVHCEVDTSKFPNDVHACCVELGVWDNDLTTVNVVPMGPTVGLKSYRPNGEWVVASTSVRRDVRNPDGSWRSVAVMQLNVARRPKFFLLNVITPAALLSLLSSFVFLIPADSGEKISFSVTILLAFGVLMSYITEMMPRTSKTTSSLSIAMVASLIVSFLFVCLAILITRLHHRNEAETPVPVWLTSTTVRIERTLCFRIPRKCGQEMAGRSSGVFVEDVAGAVIHDGLHKHGGSVRERMTWKRVSECADIVAFLVSFPTILSFGLYLIFGLN